MNTVDAYGKVSLMQDEAVGIYSCGTGSGKSSMLMHTIANFRAAGGKVYADGTIDELLARELSAER